jgi:branched-chain amino acid aminotransferase
MGGDEKAAVYEKRNALPLPAVSYTSQYGMGNFEGMKAFPRKDGKVSIFRPDRNGARFAASMTGLYMPEYPAERYVQTSVEFIKRNGELGYVPRYDAAWEKDRYAGASAVYVRPYTYAEAAIGVGISKAPYVVFVGTTVSSYFKGTNTKGITTKRVRAAPHGTGNLKCDANYVISALAKEEAERGGYMECIYLDADHHQYLQEGSSCNIFVKLKSGVLVTPELGDTILPGITRASVIEIARDFGVTVEERPVSIEEAMTEGAECFVTGTAAGVTPIESLTHAGKEAVFNNRKPGELSAQLQEQLKGLQYGAKPDAKGWNVIVPGIAS